MGEISLVTEEYTYSELTEYIPWTRGQIQQSMQ